MPERNQNLFTGDEVTDLVRRLKDLEDEVRRLREDLDGIGD